MKISIGADHRGFELKTFIKQQMPEIEWIDEGCFSLDRVDYPVFARSVSDNVLAGRADFGILICGSGIGMSMAANRRPGIYAALCWSVQVARLARFHDNANILVLAADFVSHEKTRSIIKMFITTTFKGGRYKKRLDMLDAGL
ncbi:MAG: RpiB/LacA/LacB family sugar-phosphate isomerase [bacterium]